MSLELIVRPLAAAVSRLMSKRTCSPSTTKLMLPPSRRKVFDAPTVSTPGRGVRSSRAARPFSADGTKSDAAPREIRVVLDALGDDRVPVDLAAAQRPIEQGPERIRRQARRPETARRPGRATAAGQSMNLREV